MTLDVNYFELLDSELLLWFIHVCVSVVDGMCELRADACSDCFWIREQVLVAISAVNS